MPVLVWCLLSLSLSVRVCVVYLRAWMVDKDKKTLYDVGAIGKVRSRVSLSFWCRWVCMKVSSDDHATCTGALSVNPSSRKRTPLYNSHIIRQITPNPTKIS